ncbi:ABC transporter permease [Marinomonas sp. 42_23_T18]|nr:ABC transporter permease [Marinomonas sp. 42_23_T18]
MNMIYILQKVLRALLTLILVVTFIFIVLRVTGDPVVTMLPDDTDPEIIEQMRIAWGLDKPIWIQYLNYWGGILNGELGNSFLDGRPAVDKIVERIPETLRLTLTSFFVMLLIGIPAGVFSAINRNSWIDRTIMTLSVSGFSLPNFFLGILLIIVFSIWLRWLPSSGSERDWSLVMPVITLATAGAGVIARFIRSSMLEVLGKQYVRAAIARGMPKYQVVCQVVLPNAAIPVITIVGFMIGTLIGGSIVTETIFSWPGVGRLLISSVTARDLAVVQTGIMMVAFTMILANLIVDFAYFIIDPRVRLGAKKGDN